MTRAPGHKGVPTSLAQQLHDVIGASSGCSVVLLRPVDDGKKATSPAACACALIASLEPLADRLRPIIRRTDNVLVCDGEGIALVLHDAGPDGVRAVCHRVADAIQYAAPTIDSVASASGQRIAHLGLGYATVDGTQVCDYVAREAAVRGAWHSRSVLAVLLADLTTRVLSATPAKPRSGMGPVRATSRRRKVDAVRRVEAPLAPTSATGERSGSGVAVRLGTPPHLRLVTSATSPTPEHEFWRARAQAAGIPFIVLPVRLSAAIRRAVAPDLARELRVVPVGRARGSLTVAMDNPHDGHALLRLHSATGLDIFPVLVSSEDLDRALAQLTN